MIRASWFVLLSLAIAGCGSGSSSPATSSKDGSGTSPANSSGGKLAKLKIEDVLVGKGPGAQPGDKLTMRYTGKLANGTVFDTNETAGKNPFTFALGQGAVIKGWDLGMTGMKKGGKRKLSIPSNLAYGERAMGDKITPNSDLYFDVTLVDITSKEDLDTLIIKDIKKGTGPGVKNGDTVVIDYTGTMADGTQIDSTFDRKKPYTFKVGAGKVYPGIDSGVVGMKKGGERTLQIPPELGPRSPSIPPDSITHYDIILREIKH